MVYRSALRFKWKQRRTTEIKDYAVLAGQLSAALIEIPVALVHWSGFDAAAYETRVYSQICVLREDDRPIWDNLFGPDSYQNIP